LSSGIWSSTATSPRTGDLRAVDLFQVSDVLLGRSTRIWNWAVRFDGLAFVVGVAGLVPPIDSNSALSIGLAAIVAACGLTAFALHVWFDQQYELAWRIRRQGMLSYGLGRQPEANLRRDLFAAAGAKVRKKADVLDMTGYYATTAPSGPVRLAQMQEESAFWTYHQYARLQAWVIAVGVILLLVLAGALVAFFLQPIPQNPQITAETHAVVAKIILAVVPSAVVLGLVGWAIRLQRLTREIQKVREELSRVWLSDPVQELDVLRLFMEYNCIIVQGLPIPATLNRRWRDELNTLWHAEKGTRS